MLELDDRFKKILEISKKHTETRSESCEGGCGRIITARLRPGTDLLTGIKHLTLQHQVLAGAVSIAFGSLTSAEVTWTEGSKSDPAQKADRTRLSGPLSFSSGQGKVGITEQGAPVVHFHGVLVDWEGRVWGGHFHDGGNPVFSTFEIVIHEILGVRHTHIWDDESQTKLLKAVSL